MSPEEVQAPIVERDIEGFIRCLVWLARQGRSNNQARALLESGVTLTI